MRKSLLLLPAVLFLISCSKEAAPPAPPADPAPAEAAAPVAEPTPAAEPAVDPIATAISSIDAQVAAIDAKVAAATATETPLDAQAFEGVSAKTWSKLHSYTEAGQLLIAKLDAAAPETGARHFYFSNNTLLYAVDLGEGATAGDRHYFENGAMVALIRADGASVAAVDAGFIAASTQLQNEANRLLKMGGGR
jgi:hypothetical protein